MRKRGGADVAQAGGEEGEANPVKGCSKLGSQDSRPAAVAFDFPAAAVDSHSRFLLLGRDEGPLKVFSLRGCFDGPPI